MIRGSKVRRTVVSSFGLVLMIWGVLSLVRHTQSYYTDTRLLTAFPDYPQMSVYELLLGYVYVVFMIFLGLAIFNPFWNFLKSAHSLEVPTKKKILIILVLIIGMLLCSFLLQSRWEIISSH